MLPLFLLIVMIALDFGRAFQGWVHLQQAARVAANYASTNGAFADGTATQADYDALNAFIADDAGLTSDCAGSSSTETDWFTATVATPDTDPSLGSRTVESVKVTVGCSFELVSPLGALVGLATRGAGDFASAIPLTADAVFPVRDVLVTDAVGASPEPVPPKPTLSCFPISGTRPLTTTCQGTFTGAVAAYSFAWGDTTTTDACTNADPSTDGFCQATHTYSTATIYHPTFTVTNLSGSSTSDAGTITVTNPVADPSIASFSCTTPAGCTTASSSAFVTFTWTATTSFTPLTCSLSFGDASAPVSGCSNQTHLYATGAYTATLTVTNSQGATATGTLTVTLSGNPTPTPTPAPTPTQLAYTGPTSWTFSPAPTLTATLTDSNGTPLSGRSVSFMLARTSPSKTGQCTATTTAQGVASCTPTFQGGSSAGTWQLTVTFTASGGYASSQTAATLILN